MKNKGQAEILALLAIFLLVVGVSAFAYAKLTNNRVPILSDLGDKLSKAPEGFGMKCLRMHDDGTYYIDYSCGNTLSIIGSTEGVYGIGFTLTVQNTGWSGTPRNYDTVTITSKVNNVASLDFSGDLYDAFKNGGATPQVMTNIVPGGTVTWDTTTGTCDASEISVLGSCWIPTDKTIGGHSAYETLCHPGACSWTTAVDAAYTYGGKPKIVTGSNSATATVNPDPIAGITVSLIQRT